MLIVAINSSIWLLGCKINQKTIRNAVWLSVISKSQKAVFFLFLIKKVKCVINSAVMTYCSAAQMSLPTNLDLQMLRKHIYLLHISNKCHIIRILTAFFSEYEKCDAKNDQSTYWEPSQLQNLSNLWLFNHIVPFFPTKLLGEWCSHTLFPMQAASPILPLHGFKL